MDNNLCSIKRPIDAPYQKKLFQLLPLPYQVDITVIYLTRIYLNIKRPENEIFGTSLYEIDWILDNRILTDKNPEIPDYIKLAELAQVFSKEVSDILPPYYPYNYQIQLKKPNTLSYSLLYKITTEELKEVK
jgi:hypothetical protein